MVAAGYILSLSALAALPISQPAPAVLHGVTVTDETITIEVTDCGCTEMHHFAFMVRNLPKGTREVTVLRMAPDICEAPSRAVVFEYDREHRLRKHAIVVTNELRPLDRLSNDQCHEGF